MTLPRTEMSAPKTGYFGTDPGFKSGVGAIFGRNRRRDSPLCSRHLLPGPGRSPPPIYEGGSAPCYPLRRSSPFPTLSSPKSRDRVGPLVRTSLRSTHRTARDATPVAWGLPVQPGSKRASRRAPMALRTARLAAADHRNGRRRTPRPGKLPPLSSVRVRVTV